MLNGVKRPSWRASDSICTTSSRVGAMMRTRGALGDEGGGAGVRSSRVNAAIRKAAVLPVPVCDWPATSLPLRASGSAASWMGVAVTKPASRMPCITDSGRSSVTNSISASSGTDGRDAGLSRAPALARRRRAAAEDARADDADLVEDDQRPGHQGLVEGVRRRGEHGADDERAEDGVLAVLGEHARGDDAHAGQQGERQRQLEDGAEGQ